MGYLRDVRRMTVAVSRARLGLYVLGRREVFEACAELRPAFDILLNRPDKLMLVTGELYPTERPSTEENGVIEGEVAMESVEHLGQYVFEMTNTKMKQLGDGQPMEVVEEEEEGDPDTYYEDGREDAAEDEIVEDGVQE